MAQGQQPADRLEVYRAKRRSGATPEPFGGEGSSSSGGLFVVQKHAASRLHYDLRLEHDGVLLSWAVPSGVSTDPTDKRFAAHTEDHPIDYADFEGIIPKGEYGAGAMIVWDRGSLVWDEDPSAGIDDGKLVFTLSGYKLRGQWTLVRMRTRGSRHGDDWLLIKHRDAWSREDDPSIPETSVLTGRTVEDLISGTDTSDAIRATLVGGGGRTGTPIGGQVDLMLAETAERPFSDDAWIYEIKYDGYRLTVDKHGGSVRLRYRSGADATALFPEIVTAVRRLPFDRLLVDGEVVVLDPDGRPDFTSLQSRANQRDPRSINASSVALPATFFGFDLITFNDVDARPAPLAVRKRALASVLPSIGPLRFVDHVDGRGEEVFDVAKRMGLEGVMAKRSDAPYAAGRSPLWLKIKSEEEGLFAVVGYVMSDRRGRDVSSLHLGMLVDGVLRYAGRVGSGFTDQSLDDLRERLVAHRVDHPRVAGEMPHGAQHVWVEPMLSVRVRFKEVTGSCALRHPVFLSLEPFDLASLHRHATRSPVTPSVRGADEFTPTNVGKVFWPDGPYTKGDLIRYYTAVAPHLLPFLADRPLVLDRYPEGIQGPSFFQKHAADHTPSWVRTVAIADSEGDPTRYVVAEDTETLVYLANLASIPLHVWASRAGSIERPDWCIIDLDPKGAPFSHVVTTAREVRSVCDSMGLPSFPKTSGKSGLHVLIPMGARFSYEQQRLLGELIARVVESQVGDIATTVRNSEGREGKVYIDYLQNGRGKLLVAPFSVRPVPGALVSAPLRWREVSATLDPSRFTIRSMPRRLAALSSDPFEGLLDTTPSVLSGIESLAATLS